MAKEAGFTLHGQMLIAMPEMGDPNFARTLVYVCAHNAEGALGLVVNRPVPDLRLSALLDRFRIRGREHGGLPVYLGGPVETGRGFVLHSLDGEGGGEATLQVADGIGLTATLDILQAIAGGEGPSDILVALGYAGWGPGQLEREIRDNGWLHCAADRSLIFSGSADPGEKYRSALAKIGVDAGLLSQGSGTA